MDNNGTRFLIVDDDESVHHYLGALLDRYATCDFVLSGEEGVAHFERALENGEPYDVVLMDILMPGMDGHEAACSMRQREMKQGMGQQDPFKLVMVTSLVDDNNVSKAFFDADASCYIVKPLERDKVIEELRQNRIL